MPRRSGGHHVGGLPETCREAVVRPCVEAFQAGARRTREKNPPERLTFDADADTVYGCRYDAFSTDGG